MPGEVALVVLRPPTLDALDETLAAAKAAGAPFQVVHFDGHGSPALVRAGAGGPLRFGAPGPARGPAWQGPHRAIACRQPPCPLQRDRDEWPATSLGDERLWVLSVPPLCGQHDRVNREAELVLDGSTGLPHHSE